MNRSHFRRWALGPALVVALWVPHTAQAAPATSSATVRFALEVQSCPDVPTPEIRRLLGIEIGDLLLGEQDPFPPEYDRLLIRCAGSFATIHAIGAPDAPSFEQVINLDDFPNDVTARALTLAGLELLATMNTAVRIRMDKNQRPLPPPPAPKKVTGSGRESHLRVAGTTRTMLDTHGPTLWGLRATLESSWGPRWASTFDLEAARGSSPVHSLGEANTWLFSSAAAFGPYARGPFMAACLGLGVRFGLARLSGSSADSTRITGATVHHPWGGPMITAGTQMRMGRYSLSLSAEVGQSIVNTEGLAGKSTVISVGGTWVSLAFGGGIQL